MPSLSESQCGPSKFHTTAFLINCLRLIYFEMLLSFVLNHFPDSCIWKRFCKGITRHLETLSAARNGTYCRCGHNQCNLLPNRSLQRLHLCHSCGCLDRQTVPKFHSHHFTPCIHHWIPHGW